MNGMNPSKGKQSSPNVCSTAQLSLSAAGFAGASSSAWGQRAEGGFLLDSLLPVRSWACQGKSKRAVKAQSYTCLCETPKHSLILCNHDNPLRFCFVVVSSEGR